LADRNVQYSWYSGTTGAITVTPRTNSSTNDPYYKLEITTAFNESDNWNNYILKITCEVKPLYDNGVTMETPITLEAFFPIKVLLTDPGT
jgi:hypothetical protein